MIENVWLYQGDCVEVLRSWPEASVDAVVCDPPYGLEFMGKEWDKLTRNLLRPEGKDAERVEEYGNSYAGRRSRLPDLSKTGGAEAQAWHEAWARECLRVLKPGGHLIAFGGSRTWHRMACAVEDAGFEIRDSLMWLYGSGFPKSLDVSKAIAKRAGGEAAAKEAIAWMKQERERLQLSRVELETRIFGRSDGNVRNWEEGISLPQSGLWEKIRAALGYAYSPHDAVMQRGDEEVGVEDGSFGYQRGGERWEKERVLRAAATDAAKQWAGWGTALKPAHEPVILARKPPEGTIAANVQKWGTGALNIGGCRISTAGEEFRAPQSSPGARQGVVGGDLGFSGNSDEAFHAAQRASIERTATLGRWPANIMLDEEAGAMLDAQSGNRPGMSGGGVGRRDTSMFSGIGGVSKPEHMYGDSGGASRFFYCPKPSRREREHGLDGFPVRSAGEVTDREDGSAGLNSPRAGAGRTSGARNTHPTVKPVELMRYLCRLVTPPGGVVLDPFVGSGTTGMAARLEGFRFIGIDREAEYLQIAQARIAAADTLE